MKIIKARYEVVNEPNITKKIERIARVCYKSEDKIGLGTDIGMISNLIKRKHYAMLEHGDICIEVSKPVYDFIENTLDAIENSIALTDTNNAESKRLYLRRTKTYLDKFKVRYIISGNIRAWYEFFLKAAPIGALPACLYSIINGQVNYLLDTTPLKDMATDISYMFIPC